MYIYVYLYALVYPGIVSQQRDKRKASHLVKNVPVTMIKDGTNLCYSYVSGVKFRVHLSEFLILRLTHST